MSVVTVEEAAHRLGVSVATVRRRLSSGDLAGKKVGRDWQVDESALPLAGTKSPAEAMTTFTEAEIQSAIKHVSGTDVTELWVPDILRWADFFADERKLISEVQYRLSTGTFGAASEVRIPKNALASRAGTVIDLVDRIIYQAAVSRIASQIEAATSKRVFSSRISSDPRYFLSRSATQYGAWQKETIKQLKDTGGILVSTDLSSYFDLIDQPTLLREIQELSGDIFAVDVLRRALRTWTVLLHRGIPQGPNASRLLGNAYLLPVDQHMIDQGYNYLRYMDDVSIIVADHAEAARAVADFERSCSRRGLLVSSAKTTIQTLAEVTSGTEDTHKGHVEYLMKVGGSAAREALMKMFRSAVPTSGKINITDAKFSVWRLAQRLDRGPLKRLLDRLADLGPIAGISAAYLRHFLTSPRTFEVVGDFLNDPERNTSYYLESWIHAAALEFPGVLPERWAMRARVTAFDRNVDSCHRVIAMNALSLTGRASDIALIKRSAAHEYDPEIVRGAIVALARVSKLDKPTENAIAARHPSLISTVGFSKSRRRLPSLVYRGREVPVRR